MILSYFDTNILIASVLSTSHEKARSALHVLLSTMNRSEAEFCAGVIKHGPDMKYTADQWFDFFSKVPNRLFRDENRLMNKLTESQRRLLNLE